MQKLRVELMCCFGLFGGVIRLQRERIPLVIVCLRHGVIGWRGNGYESLLYGLSARSRRGSACARVLEAAERKKNCLPNANYPPWNQTKMKIIIPFPLPPGNDYLYVAVALLQTKQHPSSSEEALGHKDWKSAMEAEYDALMKNKTWHCSSERYECHRM